VRLGTSAGDQTRSRGSRSPLRTATTATSTTLTTTTTSTTPGVYDFDGVDEQEKHTSSTQTLSSERRVVAALSSVTSSRAPGRSVVFVHDVPGGSTPPEVPDLRIT